MKVCVYEDGTKSSIGDAALVRYCFPSKYSYLQNIFIIFLK